MNKLLIISLFTLLASCGVEEPEDHLYLPEDATCWTVDGDPELYFYVLPTHAVDQQFYAHCQKMREESFGR